MQLCYHKKITFCDNNSREDAMKCRFIVVGFGFMGQTHAGNILKNPRAELAAVIDPCSPVERLASIRGNKATVTLVPDDIKDIPHYTSIEEAFAKVQADAVIVALPTKLHFEYVTAALDAGFHVMVEKPFSISLEECIAMCSHAQKVKKLLCVGYVVRYMKEYRILKEYVEKKTLGKLLFMTMSRITGIPSWGNWSDPEFIKASGGALFDLVSHDVDFARYCLGEPKEILPDRIVSKKFNGNMISVLLQCEEADVEIKGGFVTPSSCPFRRNFTAYFEGGTLISDAQGDLKTVLPEGITEEVFGDDNPYYTEVDNFITALETGDLSSVCTGEDATESIRCCSRIRDILEE